MLSPRPPLGHYSGHTTVTKLPLYLRVWGWLPPIALDTVAWLGLFATIWQKVPGETRAVRQELHRVFHPEAAIAQDQEEAAAMLRETPLRFYSPKSLTSHVGERLTMNLGWGGSGEGLAEVTLHFWEGDPQQGEAQELGSVKTMLAGNPQTEVHSEVHSEVHHAERTLVNGTIFTNANLGGECVLIQQTPAWERHEEQIELVEITDREPIISRTLDV